MNSAYFETRFHVTDPGITWPPQFVIISAYATTGETWTPAQNVAADSALAAVLRTKGVWHARVEGYSPATGHSEPSWAAELPIEEARDVGHHFAQDAIFLVSGDELVVIRCTAALGLARIGSFRERVDRGAWSGSSPARPAPSP